MAHPPKIFRTSWIASPPPPSASASPPSASPQSCRTVGECERDLEGELHSHCTRREGDDRLCEPAVLE